VETDKIKKNQGSMRPYLREDKYNALVARAIELGDVSLAPPAPVVAPAPLAPAPPFPVPHGWPPSVVAAPSSAPTAEMPKAEGAKS
jgi:hypothetical protein